MIESTGSGVGYLGLESWSIGCEHGVGIRVLANCSWSKKWQFLLMQVVSVRFSASIASSGGVSHFPFGG